MSLNSKYAKYATYAKHGKYRRMPDCSIGMSGP
jgi:hypothetical protein